MPNRLFLIQSLLYQAQQCIQLQVRKVSTVGNGSIVRFMQEDLTGMMIDTFAAGRLGARTECRQYCQQKQADTAAHIAYKTITQSDWHRGRHSNRLDKETPGLGSWIEDAQQR